MLVWSNAVPAASRGFVKPIFWVVAISAALILLGDLHHTKIPPDGALIGLAAEVLILFSGYALRR
jgi:hypothetical protein